MEVKIKIWLEKDGLNVLGDGRLKLLRTIDEVGSINAAAEKLGISYRHAWGHLKKLEERLGCKLIEPRTGGKGGGGTTLTAGAKRFLSDFEKIRKEIDSHVKEKFEGFDMRKD
ncbi:MAG: LysR family transcriptional regulator [bacterium]